MGNSNSQNLQDILKTLPILKCPNCKDQYDLDVKTPKMICSNQHNLCDKCLQQLKPKVCPQCKQMIWLKKKKNAILCYILEQMQKMRPEKNQRRTEKQNHEESIQQLQENRSIKMTESPSKRVIKYKATKQQQSIPNINLDLYNQDRQFKKKYSVASIFGALREQIDNDAKQKPKQQTLEDILNRHVEEYNIIAFREIIQNKKDPLDIINLDLHLNKISKMFQIFSKFQNLQRLNLNKNRIKRIQHINTLNSLTYLSLSDNQIENIENIEELSNLKNLYLNKNRIPRIVGLQNLAQLQFLGLGGNLIQKIECISHLSDLKWLNLEANYIQKIQGINTLKNLEIVLFGFNQISIFQGFQQLQNIKEIHIQSNKISNLGKALSMKHLRKLKLQDNPGLKEDNSKQYVKLLQIIQAKSKGVEKPDQGCNIY